MHINSPDLGRVLAEFLGTFVSNETLESVPQFSLPNVDSSYYGIHTYVYQFKQIYNEHRALCLLKVLISAPRDQVFTALHQLIHDPNYFASKDSTHESRFDTLDRWSLPSGYENVVPTYDGSSSSAPRKVLEAIFWNPNLNHGDRVQFFDLCCEHKLPMRKNEWIDHIARTSTPADAAALEQYFSRTDIGKSATRSILRYSNNPTLIENHLKLDPSGLLDEETAVIACACSHLTDAAIEIVMENIRKHEYRDRLAANSCVPDKFLFKWALMRRDDFLAAIANNPNCSEKTLSRLVRNPRAGKYTYSAICRNSKVTSKLLAPILISSNQISRQEAETALKRLAERKSVESIVEQRVI